MEISINDLDDDDILESGDATLDSQQVDNPVVTEQDSLEKQDDNDFMSDFLRSKGIEDPSRIKFEDDNGNIEERNWNDLSREEQINILNTPITSSKSEDNYFDDEEIALLNEIRRSGLTPSQFIQQFQNQTVQEPSYKIDDLSDDELYILDLEARAGDLTDEQAAEALNNAKQNQELFNKQIEGIRKEYKEREDYNTQIEQAELEQQQQEAYNTYYNSVANAIDNFNNIGTLDLNFEREDKEELADFMLSQDENGNTYLFNALQDPETLVKAAWFILNGDAAFNEITDYFVNQIKLVSENQYNKGLADGRNNNRNSSNNKSTIFIDNSNKERSRTYKSVEDLDDDD